jgi:hypothetical protein
MKSSTPTMVTVTGVWKSRYVKTTWAGLTAALPLAAAKLTVTSLRGGVAKATVNDEVVVEPSSLTVCTAAPTRVTPGIGSEVGCGVGFGVGLAVGLKVGALVGRGTGWAVGRGDGRSVGLSVGAGIGTSVGFGVGRGDGCGVGFGMGTEEGEGMGAIVGRGVGTSSKVGEGVLVHPTTVVISTLPDPVGE